MSRSFNKCPIGKKKSRFCQKQATKRCRKINIPLFDGNYYKKVYDTYDIIDYRWYSSFKKFMDNDGEYVDPEKISSKTIERKYLEYIPDPKGIPVYGYSKDPKNPNSLEKLKVSRKIVTKTKTIVKKEKISYKYSSETEKEKNFFLWKKMFLYK